MAESNPNRYANPEFPAAYEKHLVPRFFTPWGELLLSKTGIAPGDKLLDVATGPGTVARIAARKLGPKGRVTAADNSPPMLARARAAAAEPGAAPIEWIESPAAPLAVPSAAFDVAVCQQGLQFFPDRPAALAELARALKPGGWAGVAVWTTMERNTVFYALRRALESAAPELVDVMDRPFSWHAPDELRVMLHDAGFRDVVVETHTLPVIYEGGIDQVVEIFGRSPVAVEIGDLAAEKRVRFEAAFREILGPLVDGTRGVRGQMVSTIAIAHKP